MMGQQLDLPRLCAPDPAELGALLEGHLSIVATAGCFDRIAPGRVTTDPDRVSCSRCRGYLFQRPQYANLLRSITRELALRQRDERED